MQVNPVYSTVGSLFNFNQKYRVPKYQRTYAWEKGEIEDFLQDLESIYEFRDGGKPKNHFFGGIVSVEKSVHGAVNQMEFELVDGQQRMATFVLLAASLISIYRDLEKETIVSKDAANQKIIRKRISDLHNSYIEFEQEINRNPVIVDVLIMSGADQNYFRELIREMHPISTRSSHENILFAYTSIKSKISDIIKGPNIISKIDKLEKIKQVVDGDFSIIHIQTKDKNEAYKLFQVLNDRGKSLTDGDLLRARTLEILELFPNEQKAVEQIWDQILSDKSSVTEEYLRWIYISYTGKRAGATSLFDDFLAQFYPETTKSKITVRDSKQVLQTTQILLKEVLNCRKLSTGEWPYTLSNPITQWDVNRLSLLIKELRLTITMPLLLSACTLTQDKFSEIVQIVERFLFRFKIIGNQHITPAQNIFFSESSQIRTQTNLYTTSSFITQLRVLQASKVNDTVFTSALNNLQYKDGGGNQPLKYFLLTLEYYLRWYRNGAHRLPKVLDKTRIYDFTATTIEHIYPQKAPAGQKIVTLEPLINTLGNLTILGPLDNGLGGNEKFINKKPLFVASSVTMNREIGTNTKWSVVELKKRQNDLIAIALKVFTF